MLYKDTFIRFPLSMRWIHSLLHCSIFQKCRVYDAISSRHIVADFIVKPKNNNNISCGENNFYLSFSHFLSLFPLPSHSFILLSTKSAICSQHSKITFLLSKTTVYSAPARFNIQIEFHLKEGCCVCVCGCGCLCVRLCLCNEVPFQWHRIWCVNLKCWLFKWTLAST